MRPSPDAARATTGVAILAMEGRSPTNWWRVLQTALRHGQVYAVSGGDTPDSGELRVLHAGRAVEVMHAGEQLRQAITGLWSLPATPGGAAAALVVISFASCSRAMSAAGTA